MVIPSEYLQILSAGIYAIALFYTIATFRRSKRLDQITLLNNIFDHLRALDLKLAEIPSGSEYEDLRSQWHTRTFNSVNWLSLMVNEKVITDKKMIEHIYPTIVRYYEDIFLKNALPNEIESYQEFKKLYRSIKR